MGTERQKRVQILTMSLYYSLTMFHIIHLIKLRICLNKCILGLYLHGSKQANHHRIEFSEDTFMMIYVSTQLD